MSYREPVIVGGEFTEADPYAKRVSGNRWFAKRFEGGLGCLRDGWIGNRIIFYGMMTMIVIDFEWCFTRNKG